MVWTDDDGALSVIPAAAIVDPTSPVTESVSISVLNVLDGDAEKVTLGNTAFTLATDATVSDNSTATAILIDYDASSTTFYLTRSGGGNIGNADMEALLQSMTYENVDNPRTVGVRIFEFTRNNGLTVGDEVQLSIDVRVPPNVPPVLDLNGVSTGIDRAITFTEGDGTTSLCASATITDVDTTDLRGMTILCTGLELDDELLKIGSPPVEFSLGVDDSQTVTAGSGTFDVEYTAASGRFVITKNGGGDLPLAEWQSLVRTLSYVNDSIPITPGDRVLSISVHDASVKSSDALLTITVEGATNAAPIVDLNGATAGVNLTYDYASGAGTVTLCPAATVSDVDNDPMVTLTITLGSVSADSQTIYWGTGNTAFSLASSLTSTATAGSTTFSVAYVASPTKVFTITKSGGGSAVIAEWQALLRTLKYANTTTSITSGVMTMSCVINDGTDDSAAAVLSINTSSAILIDAAWLSANGPAPYYLRTPAKTYRLETDVTVDGTAFVILDSDIILDLNGHTVTYGNSTPITVQNGGFESGSSPTDIPSWSFNDSSKASRIAARVGMWGDYMLRLTSITTAQTITSETIGIPLAGVEYAASVFCRGPQSATVTIRITDSATGTVLASGNSANPNRGFAAIARFTPTTTAPIKIVIVVTPAAGQTQTVDLDYVAFERSRDYGIVCTRAPYNLPTHLRTTTVNNEATLCRRFTLQNGSVMQGTGRSVGGSAMYAQTCDTLTVTDTTFTCNGMDTNIVFGQYANNPTFLRNNFVGQLDRISNRLLQFGALSLSNAGGVVTVTDNSVTGSMHAGIVVTRQAVNDNTITIADNYVSHTALGTDGYGIIVNFVKNFLIDRNTIEPVDGRGILLDGYGSGQTTDGVVSNNTVEGRESPNLEYNGEQMEATAFRMRSFSGSLFRNVTVSGNTFYAETGIDMDWAAAGARITFNNANGLMDDANIVFEDNAFKAVLLSVDPGYTGARSPRAWGCTVSRITTGTGTIFRNNRFESNDYSLNIGDNDSFNAVNGDIDFISNTFAKAAEGVTRQHYSIAVGSSANGVTDVRFFDNTYEAGAGTDILWLEAKTKDISVGWLLDVTVTDGGPPVSGATVTVTDAAATVQYTGTTDVTGQVIGAYAPVTKYRQATSNPALITTDTLTPLAVAAVSGPKSGSTNATPTANDTAAVAIA